MSCAWYLVLTLLLQVAGDTSSITWPKGLYGLLKPNSGCPKGWFDKGWIFQDMEDDDPSNERSKILHMDGFVVPSNVLKYFCIKKSTSNNGSNWPKGQYCIYRRSGKTLAEMQWGRIRMYDEYSSGYKDNYNILRVYARYTDFYFYCQINGNKKIPISLPITKPFYLLPYGSRDCQQVKWMVATSEWIKYHTDNYINRAGQKGGKVPYHILGTRNHGRITMFYCYYESCNYTLNDTNGVFQSPGFPGKYPDGQLCSWRIMVPDDHTLHVRFTNFSLDGKDTKDNLTFFENYSGSFHLNDTFHGHHNKSFTIAATRNILFEFRTNDVGNSKGFRAEYTVSRTSEMTPSPSSPPSPPSTNGNTGQHTTPNTNTGVLHTTTIPTTETKNKTNNSTADTFKKSSVSKCDGANTAILIVIPLICLIVVIAVVIVILYRWRSKKTKCEKCASTRHPNKDATNPTYDDTGHIQIHQRTSTATMNTTVGTDDNDGQMYQALSRDQQPEYEAPDYSKQNGIDDPSIDSGYPEYHELEPMDNNVPDVVYDVLEGPDSDNGPSGEQMYQALDKETTHNPLYQSTQPATMVTRNPLYVDSVA